MCILALAILSCLSYVLHFSFNFSYTFCCFDNVRTVHRKECIREILSAVRTKHTAHTASMVMMLVMVMVMVMACRRQSSDDIALDHIPHPPFLLTSLFFFSLSYKIPSSTIQSNPIQYNVIICLPTCLSV
jgi:hypothetical protein